MAVFFTSDTHFGHGGALGLYRRPFGSVAAMNETLVARWNETVGPEDEVWHLGDFAIRQPQDRGRGLLARLNGHKHLLAGNNDPPATRELHGWGACGPMLRSRWKASPGPVPLPVPHLARHREGLGRSARPLPRKVRPQPRQIDVGVDVWDFRPVALTRDLGAAEGRQATIVKRSRSGQNRRNPRD